MPRTRGTARKSTDGKTPRKRYAIHCTNSRCSHASKKAIRKGEKKKKSDKKKAVPSTTTTISKVHKKKTIKSKYCHACHESISTKDLQECSACGHLFCKKNGACRNQQLIHECYFCAKPICKSCFDFVVKNATDAFGEDHGEQHGPHVIEMGEDRCHNCGHVTAEEHAAFLQEKMEENVDENIVCPMCSEKGDGNDAYHCFERNLLRV